MCEFFTTIAAKGHRLVEELNARLPARHSGARGFEGQFVSNNDPFWNADRQGECLFAAGGMVVP
jgi:hypothetical protein